jgi:hypothetical protein
VDEAAQIIKEMADPEANIIFGTVIDERMGDEITITVIATGFDASRKRESQRHTVHAGVDIGAPVRATVGGGRDFLRELEQQRAAAAVPIVPDSNPSAIPMSGEPAGQGNGEMPQAAQADPGYASGIPAASQIPAGAPSVGLGGGRRGPELEDLDIPAFLRRNR